MLARLQRLIVFALAAFMLGWASICITVGLPEWSGGGILLIVSAYGAVLGLQFVTLYRSSAESDPRRPRLSQLVSAWLGETIATPRIFLWRQPFRSQAEPDYLSVLTAGSRGVVLVHGFVCNRGVWNPWMRRLRGVDVPFVAIDLEPVFGSIDEYSTTIEGAVRTITQFTGAPPVIVAHSMGGLAVRAWLAQSNAAARCHCVVTMGSPHRGTSMAKHSFVRNGREMRIGSAWLARLEALERASPRPRFVCFWSRCDNIVIPSASATLAGADNRHLEATPHVQMIHHPAVFDEVLRLVDERPPTVS